MLISHTTQYIYNGGHISNQCSFKRYRNPEPMLFNRATFLFIWATFLGNFIWATFFEHFIWVTFLFNLGPRHTFFMDRQNFEICAVVTPFLRWSSSFLRGSHTFWTVVTPFLRGCLDVFLPLFARYGRHGDPKKTVITPYHS